MSVGTKMVVLLGLPLLMLAVIGILAFQTTAKLIDANHWINHTHEVLSHLESLLSVMKDAESSQRGYLLTGEESFLQPYKEAQKHHGQLLSQVQELTSDNPSQQIRLKALVALLQDRFKELQEVITKQRQGDAKAAVELVKRDVGKKIMDDAREVLGQMRDEEERLLKDRQKHGDTMAQTTMYTIGVGTALVFLFVVLAGFLTTRSIGRAGREMGERVERVQQELAEAKKDLLQAGERGRMLELICLSQGPSPPPVAAKTKRDENLAGPNTPTPRLPEYLGQYQLLEKLGEGGMGAVYRAMHTRLKRPVALKVLPADLLQDDRAVARFHREMEAVGKLDHPHIVRASDAGEDAGWHFLVMDLVEGMDLARLAGRLGQLPVTDACEVARQAASALQHANEHGLVHRDIKPSNLMLTPAGEVKVLDLGLARLYGDQPLSEVLTASGVVMGTPDYMAPEQAFEPKSVDIRADLYSLGCTLYRLIAGRPPFGDPPHDTLAKKLLAHAQAPVPPIKDACPEVPAGLAVVLERMLAKDPAERFGTPAEVEAALRPFAADQNLARLFAVACRERQPSAAATQDYVPLGDSSQITAG